MVSSLTLIPLCAGSSTAVWQISYNYHSKQGRSAQKSGISQGAGMQPFTVVLGVILGSCFSIAFSLAVVAFIFWVLQGEHPQFTTELPELSRATVMFVGLAAVSYFAFLGSLRRTIWRHFPLFLLCLGIFAIGYYYWPA